MSTRAVAVRDVCSVAAKYLSVDASRLRPESRLVDDLRADELAIVQVVLALEEAFGIDIEEEEIGSLATIADLARCVRHHRQRLR